MFSLPVCLSKPPSLRDHVPTYLVGSDLTSVTFRSFNVGVHETPTQQRRHGVSRHGRHGGPRPGSFAVVAELVAPGVGNTLPVKGGSLISGGGTLRQTSLSLSATHGGRSIFCRV